MLTHYAIVIHTLVALSSERMEVTKLGKRKRRVVSLKTKLEIIGELKTGKSQRVVALEWLESQVDTDPLHLLLVKKWKDTAAQKRGELQKQTKLTSYFTLS